MAKISLKKIHNLKTNGVNTIISIQTPGESPLEISLGQARKVLRYSADIECCLAQVMGQIH